MASGFGSAGSGGSPSRRCLSAPGLLFTAIFVAAPVLLVLAYMFAERGRFGGVEWTFTLENFRRANDPLYLDVLWSSIGIAGPATAIALVIGYPTAYAITRLPDGGAPSRWCSSWCRSGPTS